MDENNNYNNYNAPYQNSQYKKSNPFAKTSLYLGIASIVTGLIFFIPVSFIAAVLSIIFGFVSRRQEQHMEGKAIVGVAFSSVALLTMIAFFIVVFQFLNSMAGVEFINQFMEEYSEAMKVYMEFYN